MPPRGDLVGRPVSPTCDDKNTDSSMEKATILSSPLIDDETLARPLPATVSGDLIPNRKSNVIVESTSLRPPPHCGLRPCRTDDTEAGAHGRPRPCISSS